MSRAIVLVLLLVALDVRNFLILGFGGGSSADRYLVLLVPIATVTLIRMGSPSSRIRKPAPTDLPLLLLVLLALPGTLSNLGRSSTILPFLMAVAMGFMYLATVQPISEAEARRIARGLTVVGLAYAVLASAGYSGVMPWIVEGLAFRNLKLFLLAMGVAGAITFRWKLASLLLIPATVIVFRGYPSATFVLVAFVTTIALFVTRREAGTARLYMALMICLGIGLIATLSIDRSVALTTSYFASVGKLNNNVTRIALWQSGTQKFLQSPLYGDLFYGPTTASIWIQHPPYAPYPFNAPLHNDFLLLLSNGGVVSLGLFLLWAGGANVVAFRRYRGLVLAGRPESTRLVRILLVGFNSWLCVAMFNPVLQEVGTAAVLVGLYAIIMMVGTPVTRSSQDPGLGRAGPGLRPWSPEWNARWRAER